MTIHHDKLAYGKLASLKEEADEDKLAAMAQKLNASQDNNDQTDEGKVSPISKDD